MSTGRLLLLASFLVAPACAGDDPAHTHPDDVPPPGDTTGSAAVVAVDCASVTPKVTVTTPGFRFEPQISTIAVGDVVRLDPSAGHDVASIPAGMFSVPLGGDGCFRFETAGSYDFRCTPHDFRGEIIVK